MADRKHVPDDSIEIREVEGKFVAVDKLTGDIAWQEGTLPEGKHRRPPVIWAGAGRKIPMTEELCDELCDLVSSGSSFGEAAVQTFTALDNPELRKKLFYKYRRECKEFRERTDTALEERATALAEQVLEEGRVHRHKDDVPGAKLKYDTLKWAAEVGDPKRYSKKSEGATGGPAQILIITGVPKEKRLLEKEVEADVVANPTPDEHSK